MFPTELLAKHFVLGLKVRDNVLLSAFYPLGEDQHQKLHVEWIHEAEIKIARLPKVALKRQF